VMRQTLLFGGLETIIYNVNRKITDLKIYEFGNTYRFNQGQPEDANVTKKYSEEKHLAVFLTGKSQSEAWNTKQENVDFFTLKSYVYNVLKRLRIDVSKLTVNKTVLEYFSEGLDLTINNNKTIVSFGNLNAKTLTAFDIKQAVFYADFNWNNIIKLLSNKEIEFVEIPKFPEVRRDLALLINKEIEFGEIVKIAYQVEKNILKKVNLFDIYEGDKLEAGKKSYAVSFILQDTEKTLNDKQIDGIMNRLIKTYNEKLGATLR